MEHHNGRAVHRVTGGIRTKGQGYGVAVRTLLRMLLSVGTSRFDEDRDPFLESTSWSSPSTSIFD